MYELGRAAAHGSSANLKKWIMIQKDFQLIASVLPREREHAQPPTRMWRFMNVAYAFTSAT
jgi:hypothetical protein